MLLSMIESFSFGVDRNPCSVKVYSMCRVAHQFGYEHMAPRAPLTPLDGDFFFCVPLIDPKGHLKLFVITQNDVSLCLIPTSFKKNDQVDGEAVSISLSHTSHQSKKKRSSYPEVSCFHFLQWYIYFNSMACFAYVGKIICC